MSIHTHGLFTRVDIVDFDAATQEEMEGCEVG